jgi:Cys-tRNA synthase (O-phospho-L-seryl-tRNA:Cys-tRNA synthase)
MKKDFADILIKDFNKKLSKKEKKMFGCTVCCKKEEYEYLTNVYRYIKTKDFIYNSDEM